VETIVSRTLFAGLKKVGHWSKTGRHPCFKASCEQLGAVDSRVDSHLARRLAPLGVRPLSRNPHVVSSVTSPAAIHAFFSVQPSSTLYPCGRPLLSSRRPHRAPPTLSLSEARLDHQSTISIMSGFASDVFVTTVFAGILQLAPALPAATIICAPRRRGVLRLFALFNLFLFVWSVLGMAVWLRLTEQRLAVLDDAPVWKAVFPFWASDARPRCRWEGWLGASRWCHDESASPSVGSHCIPRLASCGSEFMGLAAAPW
jgi:hypothetical protein